MVTKLFVCIESSTTPTTANRPPRRHVMGHAERGRSSTRWSGYEYQYLPARRRGADDQRSRSGHPAPRAAARDRYLRNGLILFGGDGAAAAPQVHHRRRRPADTDQTHLYRFMGFDNAPGAQHAGSTCQPVGTAAAFPLYSQLGVVLYDEENFKNAGGTRRRPDSTTTSAYTTQRKRSRRRSSGSTRML